MFSYTRASNTQLRLTERHAETLGTPLIQQRVRTKAPYYVS